MKPICTIINCGLLILFQFFQFSFGQTIEKYEENHFVKSNSLANKTATNLNYCDLFESEEFNEKIIEITALMYSPVDNDPDEIFYSGNCNNKDHFTKAKFSLETKNGRVLAREFEQNDSEAFSGPLLVTVKGKFLLRYSADFGHLGRFRAQFIVNEVISAKVPNERSIAPDYNADSPILKTSDSLLSDNSTMIYAAFGDTRFGNLSDFISDETKIMFNGKPVNYKEFIDFSKNGSKGIFEYRTGGLRKNDNEWTLKGKVKVGFKDTKVKKIFNYETIYIGQENYTVKLIQISIWEENQ